MGGDFASGVLHLIEIAMVHSENRSACAMTLMLFATGIAMSVLLIAAYSRPFWARSPSNRNSSSKSTLRTNR
jgi:hypothetical protein